MGTVRDNLHVATQGCMFFQGDHHLCNAPILKNANGFFRVHKSGKIMLIYLWVTIAHAQKANQALLNSGQNLRLLRWFLNPTACLLSGEALLFLITVLCFLQYHKHFHFSLYYAARALSQRQMVLICSYRSVTLSYEPILWPLALVKGHWKPIRMKSSVWDARQPKYSVCQQLNS